MAKLTAQEWEDCQDIFTLLDRDGSGTLDFQELGNGLRGLGLNPTEAEIRAFIAEFDEDQTGGLTLEEFKNVYIKCLKTSVVTEEEVKTQFKRLDKNEDGHVDANELMEILMTGDDPLTKEEAQSIIEEFDTNGDGVLSLDELLDGLLGKKKVK
ncbi:unnamed protein product [Blepharisma stoltei]|uniref:Calmodulin n=1 Tax=Blepharisma stoltei TaxID=1481888 RepID=A0AAU9J433_9CILI|nr:unnamed protein product [Blepharisma stoltei]